jgi:cysteinyl-tRNA synthetase
MVATISKIIDNGHAYAVDGGDVFFDVASLPGYGRLSGRSQVRRRRRRRGRRRRPRRPLGAPSTPAGACEPTPRRHSGGKNV